MLVDWERVNTTFVCLCWLVAIALAVIVLSAAVHPGHASKPAHVAPQVIPR